MNNYMPTPLILDCFCDQCTQLPEDKKLHSYQLYGVIMHLGATMASGHYIAYTRASDHQIEYSDCCRENSKSVSFSSSTSEVTKTINLFKLFKPKFHSNSPNNSNESLKSNVTVNGPSLCRSKDCCGIKLSKSVIENAINNTTREMRSRNSGKSSEENQLWLECDDDVVRTLSTEEFQNLLSCKKNSPATPYLLFYSKIKDINYKIKEES